MSSSYETILYAVAGPVARITLNRPEQLNTIVPPMPDEVEDAVARATRDPDVKVIVLRGAGRAFRAGSRNPREHLVATDCIQAGGLYRAGAPCIRRRSTAMASRTAGRCCTRSRYALTR